MRPVDFGNLIEMLGHVPDRAIAEALGCSIVTVHKKRKARGIASYRSTLARRT